MKPRITLSQFKKNKDKIERENNLWLLAIVIMIIFAFGIIIVANIRLNQPTEEAIMGDVMLNNLKSCPNKVVYGKGGNQYVYKGKEKIYLAWGGC